MNCLLFYIDKSIGDAIEANELSEAEIQELQSLAIAAQRGNCIVCGEYHSLSTLANREDNVGIVFRKVLTKYTIQRAIMEKVSIIFCICRGTAKNLPSYVESKAREISIDKIVGYRWNLFQKCALICENQSDCEYYVLLGLDYCNHHNISDYTVDFTYQGGGGQTTAIAYNNMVYREKRPALCIVDSDIKYGNNCPLGKTCVDVQKMTASFLDSEPPFQTVVLQVHEVENIVPLIILSKVYKDGVSADSNIRLLKKLAEIESGAPLLYYDLKRGHPNMMGTDDASQYWNRIASAYQIDLSEFSNVFPAIVDRKYLSKAVSELRGIVYNREPLEFETCIKDIILQLEQTTFSWGCVGHPMYA